MSKYFETYFWRENSSNFVENETISEKSNSVIFFRFVPRDKMTQKCDPIVREECSMKMRTECDNVCKEQCEDKDKRVCMTVPNQECSEKPVENCIDIPKSECRKVCY